MNTPTERAQAIAQDILFAAQNKAAGASWLYPPEFHNRLYLYDGDGGVLFFLTDLYRTRPDAELRRILETAGQRLLNQTHTGYSAFSGTAGIGSLCLRLHSTLGDASWLEAARALAAVMPINPGHSADGGDLVSGFVGTGLFLLELAQATGEDAWLTQAAALADNILALGTVDGDGLKFASYNGSGATVFYYGMAHGAAGCGTFLARLSAQLNSTSLRTKYQNAALAVARWLMRGKKSYLKGCSWAVHEGSPAGEIACSWCHGAPGIGLFFLQLHRTTGEGLWLETAEACARAVFDHPMDIACRCHGYAGNAELFFSLYRQTRQSQWLSMAQSFGDKIWSLRDTKKAWPRWRDGNSDRHTRHYGYMVGISGIGHFFLELGDPDRFPMPFTP